MPKILVLNLPLPPSANNTYLNRWGRKGGRVRSLAYRLWLQEADKFCLVQGAYKARVTEPYRVQIQVPFNMRGDVDNRIKPTLDFLVSRSLTPDDSLCHGVEIIRNKIIMKEMMLVVVIPESAATVALPAASSATGPRLAPEQREL